MSKQAMQSTNDSTGKSRESVQSYQPVWMAHWMRTTSSATADQRRDDGACGDKYIDLVSRDDHMKMVASRSAKDPRKIEGDTESCRMSSKGLGAEELYSAKMKNGQYPDEIHARRPIIDHNLGCGEAIKCKGGIQLSSGVLAAEENSSSKYHFISEGTSKKPVEWVKTHFSANEKSYLASIPSQERFVGPPTHIVPYHDPERYKFDKGKAVMCPSISRPSIVPNTQVPKIIRQEHCQKQSHSADIIWDNHHLLKPGQGWLQRMQKCSHITSLPPRQCIAPEKNEQKASLYDCCPFQNLPSRVHKTMRICTTVDSIEATPRGFPKFSQTTHSLLITKKTDVNVSEETDAFRRLIAQMNGVSSIDPFPVQANRGVKLQPISSSNSEGHENVGDIGIGTSKVASKNESSAETDTMVMDIFKEERPNSGVNSTQSTKLHVVQHNIMDEFQILNIDNNLSPWIDVASSREAGHCWTSSGLPAVASSSEDIPTSSRTQSLEMNMHLSRAELPEQKSTPSARWIKRLKNSSDCSSQGTKTFNLAESLSHEKRRVLFRSILNKSIVSSEPTPKEHHGKETFLSDGRGNLSKDDKHFSPDHLPKKSKELLLSHVWIKRWLCNGSQMSQKKPETRVVCEPQDLKSSMDDLQKKQFPSIAAIALMGKSMTGGFQSCELQKRGSLTVWKTNAL